MILGFHFQFGLYAKEAIETDMFLYVMHVL